MAKSDRTKRRDRRHRIAEKNKQLEKERLVEAEEAEEFELDDDNDSIEEIQKEYVTEYGDTYPTSFDEVDAMEDAREKAMKMNDVSWTASDLVRNITRSPMPPEEKATAIGKVGTDLSARIKSILGNTDTIHKEINDMDLLELEALIGRDQRHIPFIEKMNDFIQKAKLTAAMENKLSDDDFALVVERDGKKVRKYPIHDKAHVRNALARAAQMIKEGGMAATDARAALPKIKAAAKKMGIGMEKDYNSIIVEKDTTDQWRAVMWPSNNFKDFDGEILSKAAHEEYVDWVNENMEHAPVFISWHIPETVRKNRVDFVGYESGFLLMSAPLEEDEAAGLFRVQKDCDLGMSHGTIVLERDRENPKIVTKYRMVEVSDLPLDRAANPFTDFSVIAKEADMKEEQKEYLTKLLGPEQAAKFIEKAGLKQQALKEAGLEEKEKKDDPAPEQTLQETQTVDMTAILKSVREDLDVEGLEKFIVDAQAALEKVPVLESIIKELSVSNEEALADQINPPISKRMAWSRPSEKEDNVINKDAKDPILEEKPQLHWLSDISHTEPVKQEA